MTKGFFDIATTTGFAISDDKTLYYGKYKLKGETNVSKIKDLQRTFDALIKKYEINKAYLEETPFQYSGRGQALARMNQYVGAFCTVCIQNNVDVTFINVSTARKNLFGKVSCVFDSKTTKILAVKKINAIYNIGLLQSEHDIADALTYCYFISNNTNMIKKNITKDLKLNLHSV